jgi:lantibiotic transport system ATP-binding protein
MNESIVETKNLNFSYSRNSFNLENINLRIQSGSIYGFLGPNGAGKTTTIRLLLGLLVPDFGTINLFGEIHSINSIKNYSDIGAMIETPSLYEHLSGYDNLEITGRIKKVAKRRILEVLEIVKLTNAANISVKKYSMGMKQRLGLALALLSHPKLLVLDEPTNGLDPQGMIETRELLIRLNREYKTTILISSHLLSEIERLVTHLGIINRGKMIFQGTIGELQNLKSGNSNIRIDTSDNHLAFKIIEKLYPVKFSENDILEIQYTGREQVALLCKSLIAGGVDIFDFQIQKNDLEKLFLELTSNTNVTTH